MVVDWDTWRGIVGLAVVLILAWLASEGRRRFPWQTVLAGLGAQLVVAAALLRLPPARAGLRALNGIVEALSEATRAGTSFVFGYVGGAPPPFEPSASGSTFVLAFQALPIVLVMSALSAMLWHWRVLPAAIRGLAWALRRVVALPGSVSLAAAANVFVGMVEAPLLIRPVVDRLSRADLFLVMTCGMATVAGTMLVLYAGFLSGKVDNPLGQILTASVISVPAAVLLARVMVPEAAAGTPTRTPAEAGPGGAADTAPGYQSTFDALVRGTEQGLQLLLSIVAMLLVLVALVALVNQALGLIPVAGAPLSLERLLGWVFAPVVWLIGVPWAEAAVAGKLMGLKTVLNELIAYRALADTPAEALGPRGRLIMAYALCGFANPGSLGIMLAGLTGIAPGRRGEIIALGPRSLLSGTLATLMTGAVVGLVASS